MSSRTIWEILDTVVKKAADVIVRETYSCGRMVDASCSASSNLPSLVRTYTRCTEMGSSSVCFSSADKSSSASQRPVTVNIAFCTLMEGLFTLGPLEQNLSLSQLATSNAPARRIVRRLKRLEILPTRLPIAHQMSQTRPLELRIHRTAIDPQIDVFVICLTGLSGKSRVELGRALKVLVSIRLDRPCQLDSRILTRLDLSLPLVLGHVSLPACSLPAQLPLPLPASRPCTAHKPILIAPCLSADPLRFVVSPAHPESGRASVKRQS